MYKNSLVLGEEIMKIYVDADACPVVKIVEKVAAREDVPVMLLCDTNHVLSSAYSEVKVIGAGADAVDFALINLCRAGDIVVTQDYGVAAMALGKSAYAIHQSGKWYTCLLYTSYSISYGTYRLAKEISDYHKAYPKVNLQISSEQSGQLYQQMLDGSLDIAIIRGEYPWEGIKYMISEEKVYSVCSRENQDKPLSDYMYINRKTDPLLVGQMMKWLREG